MTENNNIARFPDFLTKFGSEKFSGEEKHREEGAWNYKINTLKSGYTPNRLQPKWVVLARPQIHRSCLGSI